MNGLKKRRRIKLDDEKARVMVIGLDGATFKLLRPWVEDGELDFISECLKEGTHGELETVYPTLSTLAWPCFYTGKNPGKLGIFGYTLVEDIQNPTKGGRIVNSSHVKSPSVWKLLSEAGKKVGVVNIPVTYPPESVNGFLISGFLSPPNRNYTHPPNLEEEIGGYEVDLEFEGRYGVLPDSGLEEERALEKQAEITRKRFQTSLKLIKSREPDFFVLNFKGVDTMQHLFWNDESTLLEYYESIDRYTEKLYKAMDPTHLFLMSDHGFHESADKYFFINTWLKENGYLQKSQSLSGNILDKLVQLGLKMAGKLEGLRETLPTSMKEDFLNYSSGKQIDFENTRAYGSRWGIFLNESGDEKEELIKKLVSDIQEVKDPDTGEKVFKELVLGEENYSGDFAEKLPDIIPIPRAKYKLMPNLAENLVKRKLDKPYIQGQHKSDPFGILVVKGNQIKEDSRLEDSKITDLFPTILHLMDVQVPSNIDGRVLKGLFKNGSQYRKEIERKSTGDKVKGKEISKKSEKRRIKKRIERLEGI